MDFLKVKTCWTNLELGLIKVCVGSLYISLGIYFYEFLKDYLIVFGILFIITAIWTFILCLKKMKVSSE